MRGWSRWAGLWAVMLALGCGGRPALPTGPGAGTTPDDSPPVVRGPRPLTGAPVEAVGIALAADESGVYAGRIVSAA